LARKEARFMDTGYGTVGDVPIAFVLDSVQVTPGIHLLKAPMGGLTTLSTSACAYIGTVVVDSASSLAVVDPGLSYHPSKYIVPFLQTLDKEPNDITLIVNTHDHFDHVDGNLRLREISGAPLAAHANAASTIAGGVDTPLADGDRLSVGEFDFEVLHTPGHSPTHICLWEPEIRLLICGDAIQANGAVEQGLALSVELDAYIGSLERLQGLDIDHLVPAHMYRGYSGPVMRGPEAHSLIEGSIHQVTRYREELVRILNSAPRALSRHEIHVRLLEALTWDPDELKVFYVNFLGLDSRPTVEALLRQLPTEYGDRVTDDKWPDVGEMNRPGFSGGSLV
jgi:glyoxylase-like metal-dependent hydrolase (beta-lactamase superfamily II)